MQSNPPPQWRQDLTFSARVATVMAITTSYQTAFPESSISQAQAEARRLESSIYKDATTEEDYNNRISAQIATFNRLHLHQSSTNENDQSPSTFEEVEPTTEELPSGPSQTIGPYPNSTYHANGLFSTIYRTRDISPPHQFFALKLTNPSTCSPPHNPHREARILSSSSHPNIIPLLKTHILKSTSQFLLVFPFHPLDLSVLLREGKLSRLSAKSIIRDLFSALAYLHDRGIIHRDVKPSNILLSPSPSSSSASSTTFGPAYLADFGIAWSPTDDTTASSQEEEPPDRKITDVGTTCYRPPELLFGKRDYGCAIDLWAAGCVVAEMVVKADCNNVVINKMHSGGRGWKVDCDWTLFTAGALGSELALIQSIFSTLGTPDEVSWPESSTLPDWGKMSFIDFPPKPWSQILPLPTGFAGGPQGHGRGQVIDHDADVARDFVGRLVRYESGERMGGGEVSLSFVLGYEVV